MILFSGANKRKGHGNSNGLTSRDQFLGTTRHVLGWLTRAVGNMYDRVEEHDTVITNFTRIP